LFFFFFNCGDVKKKMPRRVESEREILRQREQQESGAQQQQQAAATTPPIEPPAMVVAQPEQQLVIPHQGIPVSLTATATSTVLPSGDDVESERFLQNSNCLHEESPTATYVVTSEPHGAHQPEADTTTSSDRTSSAPKTRKVRIAVQGCCHGELDKIYEQIREHEASTGETIDFLLCCGDFQSIRNKEDMQSMAVPDKYKTYGDFVKYYRGEKRVPVLTLFIGGNHEASNLLAEEYYGGYVSDGIFYLGHSSVVTVCGVRIGSLSGIYKGRDYTRPYPTVPYDHHTMRDAYHVRGFEVEKLHRYAAIFHKNQQQQHQQQSPTPGKKDPHAVDIMLSHDWPVGITKYGNEAALLRIKPYFADDIAHGVLGNPYTMELLNSMRPKYWFAAHLHCHFTAQVSHFTFRQGSRIPSVACPPTEFIALDKCIHQSRKCLTFMTIEVDDVGENTTTSRPNGDCHQMDDGGYPPVIMDPVWVDLIKQTHPLLRTAGGRGGDSTAWERSLDALSEICAARPPASGGAAEQPQQQAGLVLDTTTSLLRSLQLGANPLIRSGNHRAGAAPPSHQQAAPLPVIATGPTTLPSHNLLSGGTSTVSAEPTVEGDDGDFAWVEDTVGRVGRRR
jgi:lariat debranching enzyme